MYRVMWLLEKEIYVLAILLQEVTHVASLISDESD